MADLERTYLLPKDIIAQYPLIPFSPENIGRMYQMDLLKGFSKGDKTYIQLASLFALVEYRNQVILSKTIELKNKLA